MSAPAVQVVRWASAGVIAAAALVRLMSIAARTPYWDIDPSRAVVPETGMLPSWLLELNAAVWIAGAAGVIACKSGGIRWKSGLLVLAGCVGCFLRGVLTDGWRSFVVGNDAAGWAWATALFGAWALTHLARDRALQRAVLAVLVGACVMLAAKGVHQVFIDHPRTVAAYKTNPAEALISQGIEPGSTSAREFERRLMQPEAIGWVGLSNAYASVMAAGMCVLLAAAIGAWRGARRSAPGDDRSTITTGHAGVLTLALLATAFGWTLAFSKGGTLAGVLGVVLVLAALKWGRRGGQQRGEKLGWIGVSLPMLALALVCVRGAIGTRIGELSVLFRWQYLVGATRVFADNWLFGCGPAGFKAAYVLHKVPIAPEAVDSPHSVFFDWLACLGILGAAWVALLMAWSWKAARNLDAPALPAAPSNQSEYPRRAWWWCAGVIVLTVVVTTAREWEAVALDELPLRAVALGLWLAVAWVMLRWRSPDSERCVGIGAAAAALVLVVHGQIEVAPVLSCTCAWVLAIIGTGSVGSSAHAPARAGRLTRLAAMIVMLVCFAAASGQLLAGRFMQSGWEHPLCEAARVVEPVARLHELAARLDRERGALQEAAAALGLPPGSTAEQVRRGATRSGISPLLRASEALIEAYRARPTLPGPLEAALRLQVQAALDAAAVGSPDAPSIRNTVLETARSVPVEPIPESLLSALASVHQAVGAMSADRAQFADAARLWERVAPLDPYALPPAAHAAYLWEEVGDRQAAAKWARKALEVNELLRLDAIKMLDEKDRLHLEGVAQQQLDAGR